MLILPAIIELLQSCVRHILLACESFSGKLALLPFQGGGWVGDGVHKKATLCLWGLSLPHLLAITKLLGSRVQRFLLWFSVPSCSRCGHKHPHPADRHDHRYTTQKPEWLKHEIIRLTGTASDTHDNETCHARFPHLNPLPQAGEEANEALREFYVTALIPQAGCRSIADICNRRFAAARKVTVGKTYVHQVLQRHDCEIQILRRNLKHAKPKDVPRNLIYGKPKVIRTDNEACPEPVEVAIFTSRIFSLGLKMLGIRHQRTAPGCPWQNGRIERLFGTLKQKLDQRIYFPLPQELEIDFLVRLLSRKREGIEERVSGEGLRVREQLNRDLDTFRYWYNHIRPHHNLNGKTPAEAWRGCNPYTKPLKQEYWFEAWDGLLAGYCLRY